MAVSSVRSWFVRLVLGCTVAAIILIVVLLSCEFFLRVSGSGHPTGFSRVEVDSAGRRWIRENEWVTAPFFAPELIRRPQPFRLPEKKEKGTYRIFVLGSSAAMGDPEPSFSMSRQLEVMLRVAYPKIKFEVINAGITAVNSHVVRGIAADCARLEPDLFVVYEGHNEVIGPFGPATVFTPVLRRPLLIRLAVSLRGTRMGQWLTGAARRGANGPGGADEWGGMQMFLKHEVFEDDPALEATRSLFEDNLRAIASSGTRAGASVFLCTTLANQRDFSPFVSKHPVTISSQNVSAADELLSLSLLAAERENWPVAEQQLEQSLKIDPAFAEAHFRLGQMLLRTGGGVKAKEEFQRALDLDLLRFRADSKLNDVVRKVGSTGARGVSVLDATKGAENESTDKILGDEFFYEHVHLNFRGTYLVARNLYEHVSSDLTNRGLIMAGQNTGEPISIDEVRERLAFTTYEQAMIGKELLRRFVRPPFTSQSSNARRVAAFREREVRADRLLALPESRAALFAIYERAIAGNPADWILHRNYGMALVAMDHPEKAKDQLLDAIAIIPDDPDTLFSLILAYRQLGHLDDATRVTETLRRHEPSYPGLAELK